MSDINFDGSIQPSSSELSVFDVMSEVPEKEVLLLADALLFSVYGWTPDKIRKMQLSSIRRWLKLAKKRMTWGDAFKLRKVLEPKKVSLWQKILKIKS